LFDRVAEIIDQARSNVVRAVNSNMVLAYWLIGREVVQSIQGGTRKAAYGSGVLETLARNLTSRYGPGFSKTSLKYFRSFYLAYGDRLPEISRPLGDLSAPSSKGRPLGDLLPEGKASRWAAKSPPRSLRSFHGRTTGR